MTKQIFVVGLRSRTGDPITSEVVVDDGQDPMAMANIVANARGATVDSVFPKDPITALRYALKQCLGFVEAWQAHLSDTGNTAAAVTVGLAAETARHTHRLTGNTEARESGLTIVSAPVFTAETPEERVLRIMKLKENITPGLQVRVENGFQETLVPGRITSVEETCFRVKVGARQFVSEWDDAEIVVHKKGPPTLLDRSHSYSKAI